MAIAFPKKLPDMPKAGWKDWFDKFKLSTPAKKEKATAPPKEKKKLSKKPEKTPPLDKPPEKSSLAFPKPPPKEKKKPKPLKRTPLKPPTKPNAQIWKKRRERIDSGGSETDMNREIWNTRPHACEQCWVVMEWALEPFKWIEDAKGEKVQKLIRPECFAHKLAKKMYPQHRLDPRNIEMVCSRECHKAVDIEWSDLEWRRLFDEELTKNPNS